MIMGKLLFDGKLYVYKSQAIAARLGIHRNTLDNILKRGVKHPKYFKVLKTITEHSEVKRD
jgi:hypothetical protein